MSFTCKSFTKILCFMIYGGKKFESWRPQIPTPLPQPLFLYGPRRITSNTATFYAVYPNLFQVNVVFLYPLKTSENLWFSDVFRGYRKGTLTWNGLIKQDSKLFGSFIAIPEKLIKAKKSSKTGQDEKTLISAFACFFNF